MIYILCILARSVQMIVANDGMSYLKDLKRKPDVIWGQTVRSVNLQVLHRYLNSTGKLLSSDEVEKYRGYPGSKQTHDWDMDYLCRVSIQKYLFDGNFVENGGIKDNIKIHGVHTSVCHLTLLPDYRINIYIQTVKTYVYTYFVGVLIPSTFSEKIYEEPTFFALDMISLDEKQTLKVGFELPNDFNLLQLNISQKGPTGTARKSTAKWNTIKNETSTSGKKSLTPMTKKLNISQEVPVKNFRNTTNKWNIIKNKMTTYGSSSVPKMTKINSSTSKGENLSNPTDLNGHAKMYSYDNDGPALNVESGLSNSYNSLRNNQWETTQVQLPNQTNRKNPRREVEVKIQITTDGKNSVQKVVRRNLSRIPRE